MVVVFQWRSCWLVDWLVEVVVAVLSLVVLVCSKDTH